MCYMKLRFYKRGCLPLATSLVLLVNCAAVAVTVTTRVGWGIACSAVFAAVYGTVGATVGAGDRAAERFGMICGESKEFWIGETSEEALVRFEFVNGVPVRVEGLIHWKRCIWEAASEGRLDECRDCHKTTTSGKWTVVTVTKWSRRYRMLSKSKNHSLFSHCLRPFC